MTASEREGNISTNSSPPAVQHLGAVESHTHRRTYVLSTPAPSLLHFVLADLRQCSVDLFD